MSGPLALAFPARGWRLARGRSDRGFVNKVTRLAPAENETGRPTRFCRASVRWSAAANCPIACVLFECLLPDGSQLGAVTLLPRRRKAGLGRGRGHQKLSSAGYGPGVHDQGEENLGLLTPFQTRRDGVAGVDAGEVVEGCRAASAWMARRAASRSRNTCTRKIWS